MRNIGSGAAGLPAATALIPGPLVQRQARHIGVRSASSPFSMLPLTPTCDCYPGFPS